MKYITILSKISLSQAFPFKGYSKLRLLVTQEDYYGTYVPLNYSPFVFIHDN